MHNVKASNAKLIQSFTTYATQTKRAGSLGDAGGKQVSVEEMRTGIGILSTTGDILADWAKASALLNQYARANLEPAARRLLEKTLKILPDGPVDPGPVALYSVTIRNAIEGAGPDDLNRLRALRTYAKMVMEPHGGVSGRVRRTIEAASASSMSLSAAGIDNSSQHHPTQVRAAYAELDQVIKRLERGA